jgi:hypothetical protein
VSLAWLVGLLQALVQPGALAVTIEGAPHCTAVAIGPCEVLTAGHCVREDLAVDGVPVLAADRAPAADLALLQLARPLPVARLEVPAAPPTRGALVEVRRLSTAASAVVLERDAGQLYTTPATCAGDSGAPLFDEAGRLVGLASSRARAACGQGPSVFVELSPHATWIRQTRRGCEP